MKNSAGIYGIAAENIKDIEYALKEYIKNLFVNQCIIAQQDENDIADEDEIKQESIEYFEYIYKNEEHPY